MQQRALRRPNAFHSQNHGVHGGPGANGVIPDWLRFGNRSVVAPEGNREFCRRKARHDVVACEDDGSFLVEIKQQAVAMVLALAIANAHSGAPDSVKPPDR